MWNRFAVLFLIFVCCLTPAAAYAEVISPEDSTPAVKVVRVAFPQMNGLSEVDEEGNYSGYTYEYLQEIAQYTGWEYEFVEIPGDINESLLTMMDMLEKGEIDLMGAMVKNDETLKQFDFSEYGYGFSYATLLLSEENTQLNESNYQGKKGLKIGVLKTAVNNKKKVEAFCEVNNIDFQFVECASSEELLQAVRNGRADLMLGSDLSPIAGMRSIAQFSGVPFYFATTKGNAEMVNALNSSILTIQQVKPAFDSTLYDKYFANRSYKTYLSDQEKQFIENAEELRIAIVDHMEPIQYVNEAGELSGIFIDMLARVQKETGLKMKLIPVNTYLDAIDLMKEGKADGICGIPYDYALAQKYNLLMTNSFLTAQDVLIKKSGVHTEGSSYAVVNRLQSSLTEENDGALIPYPSARECLQAVLDGSLSGAYLNLYSAEYLLQDAGLRELRLVPQDGMSNEFCIGFKKPIDTTVISIINKVRANLPPTDVEAMIYQNTMSGQSKVTLEAFVKENPFLIIGIITTVFLVFALIGFLVLWMRIRAGRQLAVENQRYIELSNLANEFIYEYDCSKDRLSFSQEFSRLFGIPEQIEQVKLLVEGKLPAKETIAPNLFALFQHMAVVRNDANPEVLCRLPGGEQRWYRSTQTEIKDREGTVLYVIGKITDVQEEKEEKAQLERRILIDGLTGIYNSVASKDFIQERLNKLDQCGALLIIDIDRFKEVNDRLGHYTGDIVLKEVAELFRAVCAADDIVGRLGGDEFVLFVSSAGDKQKLEAFCTRLCHLVRKEYTNEDGASCRVSISIGAAMARQPCPFAELYQAADKLLYRSKEKGRDCFTISDTLDWNEQ